MKKNLYLYLALTLSATVLILFYVSFHTYGNWAFALSLRGKRVFAFLLVAIATSISTIAFQTLTHNTLLTPGILGFDQIYVLIQTLFFFFLGGSTVLQSHSLPQFLGTIALMVAMSTGLSYTLLKKARGDIFLVLMVGIVAGTIFSSLSTALQVVMDPNEYDLLQSKLFASFGQIDTQHFFVASGLIALGSVFLWYLAPELDVVHLGRDHATILGVEMQRLQVVVLASVALLSGTATALVGPTIFLGFIAATLSYQLFQTYRHRSLFLGSTLISICLLVGAQILVEQLFGFNVTISTVIEFTGGLLFLVKIIQGRSRQ
ncbi:iron chelate uptake ABC transporter family permease subunit [uncultured Enterococcus sp.]|uniref:iron chelate uptake ABC transporter family permease subunit n=1 Tax=uncultured Enterococcus sp. TaxID=167972 RepID=UPI0025EB18C5|nr:iron chelate uptake ABC transporter family permease subunit [uncultured Enterococcus sp.]